MRRFSGLAVVLLACGVGQAAAQGYFGQNKVQYNSFEWQVIRTDHFEVYFYERERTAALDAARMAERGYARLSRILNHQFKVRKPIILYASSSDFIQTNTSNDLSEGIGGFTEPLKHRMVLPFTGSYEELEHVLQHEMVHQFQFDVYAHGQIGGGLQTLTNVQPPLWFMEGMAEYLSLGPPDALTMMWLRDAAIEGTLPSIAQMTFDPRVFPYHFGHALMAYVGEKWGDEIIGEILQSSVSAGIEGAFRRALNRPLEELSDEWRDAVQTTVLPQLADHYRARRIAKPVLTQRRSGGGLHLSAALSPDGKDIVYLSERNSFFIDLYIADGETGRVKRQLIKSTINSNYESLRFINSAGSFSQDGQFFAIAVKHKDRDDIVIIDVAKDREAGRIPLPLNGALSPSWSPDGTQIVFTGQDGGISDLFIVNRDGTDLRRLTNDRYADLQASWSPDGKTIAFATDRGPGTDFSMLRFGNMRIGLYHLETGHIEVLNHMDRGRNVNPVWAPDGKSLVFVSDRTGITNLFLYDLMDRNIYQLTDVYTGVSGITPLSPCLSWARQADRLAFGYYEGGNYNVYTVDNPRSLRREPYREPVTLATVSMLPNALQDAAVAPPAPTPEQEELHPATSTYRSPGGLRSSDATPALPDSSEAGATAPVSVRTLLDSVNLALPDTATFQISRYRTRFSTDFVAQPTIGYQRDNFGRGVFGGTGISLSDMLGDRTLNFAFQLNGRVGESQFLAAYFDQRHRTNRVMGVSQTPNYYYIPSSVGQVTTPGAPPGSVFFTTRIRRLVVRDAFVVAFYPLNRFNRIEYGLHLVGMSDAILQQQQYFDASGRPLGVGNSTTSIHPSIGYVAPTIAYTHDNTLFGPVGPFAGSRHRLQIAPAVGGWRFTGTVVDLRRYFFAQPFTLAFRGLFFGRFGRDANQFPVVLGNPDLIRGYTATSIVNHECYAQVSNIAPIIGALPGVETGCPALDQLIGSRAAVANVELRFPLTRSLALGLLPVALPPIEGAMFFDVGMSWLDGSTIVGHQPVGLQGRYRSPLKSWGGSIRANILGIPLRFDYTKPLDRAYDRPYWTVSLGPTF